MEFTRLTKQYVAVDLAATGWDGAPIAVTGADAALTDRSATPTATTTWRAALFDAVTKTVRVLVAGPDADPAGALPLGDLGGRLWFRNVDDPEAALHSAAVIRVT